MRRLSLTLLVFVLACGGEAPPSAEPGPDYAVSKTEDAGPVQLTVRLTAKEISLAEPLRLEEELRAAPGFNAELPEFLPDEFEGFGIADVREDPPARRDGALVLRRRFVLEPRRSGELTLPAREAWFWEGEDGAESAVSVEPPVVTVRPIGDPEAVAPPDLIPVLRPEDVGGAGGPSPWWLLLAAPLLVAAGVVVLRRRPARRPPPRPAHEIAWEALRRLAAAKLFEQGETERFFVILTAILRDYVERRFGVRAPERTTEEFLREAARHPSLAAHEAKLRAFLTTADRVKFAREETTEAVVQAAFDTAREFVTATQSDSKEGDDA